MSRHQPRIFGDQPFETVSFELMGPSAAGEPAEGETRIDPVEADAEHYTQVWENDQVRVLRISYGPGEKSTMHYHREHAHRAHRARASQPATWFALASSASSRSWMARSAAARSPGPLASAVVLEVYSSRTGSRLLPWDLDYRLRILVVVIQHPEFEGLRVSPSVYTTEEEIDRFADAGEEVLRNGLAA